MPTRSFASRFESGSSSRKACGSRTIARPIATRWRWPPESCARLALEQLGEAEQPGGIGDARARSRPCRCASPSGRSRGSGAPSCAGRARSSGRPSRCRGPSARASVTSRPPIEICPSVTSLEPGDHPQQRRLPAARRPDEDEELAVLDLERDAVDGGHAAERLADVFEVDPLPSLSGWYRPEGSDKICRTGIDQMGVFVRRLSSMKGLQA